MARVNRSALVASRRRKVEQLYLRGLSQREIVTTLEQQRVINPTTLKPWSLGTINSDLQALEDEWNEAALETRQRKKAQVAAEIKQLKRVAWSQRDYKLVGDLLRQERQLFNLDEPIQVNMNVSGQVDHEHRHTLDMGITAVDDMDEAELDQLISNLLVLVDGQPMMIEGEVIDD